MDFNESCYFVNCIDGYVHDFVQDVLAKDELINMVSEKEEPFGEIAQEEELQEVQDKPISGKKWWKLVNS